MAVGYSWHIEAKVNGGKVEVYFESPLGHLTLLMSPEEARALAAGLQQSAALVKQS